MTCTEQRRHTAWHEAGHAAAYIASGLSFRYVTLAPRSPDALGLVRLNRPRLTWPWVAAPIMLAGPLAEMAAMGRDDDPWHEWNLNDALMGAAIMARTLPAEQQYDEVNEARRLMGPESLGALIQMTTNLLEVHWPAVEAVARGLLASRRALTYREVVALAPGALVSAT